MARDAGDPLAELRQEFHLPKGLIYLDGNSLGPLSHGVRETLSRVIAEEWGEELIRAWDSRDWIDLPRRAGEKIAPLLGAAPGQVLVADSTSVNLFKVLAAALGLAGDRRVILSEERSFPSDLYIAQGLSRLLGRGYREERVPAPRLVDALSSEVAVLSISHVDYRNGALHDMRALTAAARKAGVLVAWDLSHSAGVVPMELDSWGVDFAVGCGYKFLNGGPGAPAFVYVAERHQRRARQPLAGWLGHADPFAFSSDYRPAPGVERFACGTPAILSLAALDRALDLYRGLSVEALRNKSLALSTFFLELAAERCGPLGLRAACPLGESRRGSQVVFRHQAARAVSEALRRRGVIGDCRPPDILRFGLAPMYLGFADVWDAVDSLVEILTSSDWRSAQPDSRVP